MSAGQPAAAPLELWGGFECTVNRVGDRTFDQLERTGHAERMSDLDLVRGLGIRTLRYPLLWERIAPDGIERADWRWADARMERLRELGIRPIVGLLHHGSGPRDTSLLDPAFPRKLARFAGAVAERYPWVGAYTPVNEPLTTARFSGLYGFWYPHRADRRSFLRALLQECHATVLAMEAIRAVRPDALLVATEDHGRTYATARLGYQAEHDNARRFLGTDLLCGRVDERHRFWPTLVELGAAPAELERFAAARPPDLLGVNYYVTSDRRLDERLEHYPIGSHGGNGRERYADVEAARAHPTGILGHAAALDEIWRRYRIPVALTEVHIGDWREQQLRWLLEAWDGAERARAAGADVRAVTVWSLLGAFDWNRLVTADDGFYESGPFDLRGGAPRPTALAALAGALARGERFDHPAADGPGWWRRPSRLVYGPASARPARASSAARPRRPILIAGGGTLGRAFARLCEHRGLAARLLGRAELDISDESSVETALREVRPWALVNAAGYVRVDDAERDRDRCYRENAVGPAVLARRCAERALPLVTFSSDLVFDGRDPAGDKPRGRPYLEPDRVAALSVYGASKARAEADVLAILPGALVVRTSAFFGPWDAGNFVHGALSAIASGRRFRALADVTVSPTYVPDLVHACLDLLIDGEGGIWHLANQGSLTWAELARTAARLAGLDSGAVEDCVLAELELAAPRPRYSALGSARGQTLPPVERALACFFADRR